MNSLQLVRITQKILHFALKKPKILHCPFAKEEKCCAEDKKDDYASEKLAMHRKLKESHLQAQNYAVLVDLRYR